MIYFFNIIGMTMLVASVLIMAVIHAISPIDRPYRVHLVADGVLVIDRTYRYFVIRPNPYSIRRNDTSPEASRSTRFASVREPSSKTCSFAVPSAATRSRASSTR